MPHTNWTEYFHHRGYRSVHAIGQGMEGTVYRLNEEVVGKVWHNRGVTELHALQAFYRELSEQKLPFATPEILEIRLHNGRAVSIERHLDGVSLLDLLKSDMISQEAAYEATYEVVRSLRTSSAGSASKALPVLDETESLWKQQKTWPATLAELVRRRAERFRHVLKPAVAQFDTKLARVLELLNDLPEIQHNIVHGDISPENILVGRDNRPTAVIDWGFLTTAGDNVFDATTAAGFYDMYSPSARTADDYLFGRFVDDLGYPSDVLLLYRAAYAIAGANSYGSDGKDGHFGWCIDNLARTDVTEALGL